MANYLANAVNNIVESLRLLPHEGSSNASVWQCLIEELVEVGTFQDKLGYVIEGQVQNYIEKLDDEEKFLIWKETGSGVDDSTKFDHHLIDLIEIDLQTELLLEILDYASEEAKIQIK